MKTLIIGSSTRTIRAQEILQRQGIYSKIQRLNSAADGCIRGLQVEDGQAVRVVKILAENGVPVKGTTDGAR